MAAVPKESFVVTDDKQESKSTSSSDTQDSVQLDDADLKELEEAKKVPYDRFKEVNEEKKILKSKLGEMESRYQEDLRRAVRDAELRTLAERQESTEFDDVEPWERQMRTISQELEMTRKELDQVKGESASVRLDSKLQALSQKYPEADQSAVLGWKKSQPHADIEELMQLSHNKNVEYVQGKLKSLLDKKKEKRSYALPTGGGSIRFKPAEKPKTIKEAGKALKDFFAKN